MQLPSGHLIQGEPLWRESNRSAKALLDRTHELSSLYKPERPESSTFSSRPENELLAPEADSGDCSVC